MNVAQSSEGENEEELGAATRNVTLHVQPHTGAHPFKGRKSRDMPNMRDKRDLVGRSSGAKEEARQTLATKGDKGQRRAIATASGLGLRIPARGKTDTNKLCIDMKEENVGRRQKRKGEASISGRR